MGPDGVEREPNSKATLTIAAEGAVRLRAPGAGGYGPPGERDPARLRDDVINGYVSREAALGEYGHGRAADLSCPECSRATAR
jgi:N-methylhydantoinase B